MTFFARRSLRGRGEGNYWPGFVDAMAQLLLVVIFLLSVFMMAQFLLSRDIFNRDVVLARLQSQVQKLSHILSLEKNDKERLLQGALSRGQELEKKARNVEEKLGAEKQISARALEQVDALNIQISDLRKQLMFLSAALGRARQEDINAQAQITDLGNRLNIALAERVKELEAYRSEFLARLKGILAKREDVKVLGDRFVFQSEVFFAKGSGDLTEAGKKQLSELAEIVKVLEAQIPKDISWVLEVGGHTDKDPIRTPLFHSNWELSSARALSVVHFLVAKGVLPRHLVASGYGEFQPVAMGETPEDHARNRRIEFKLTQ